MADNAESKKPSGKKDNKTKKKEGKVSETDGHPSTSSGTEGNNQKNKKEKPKKADKKNKPKSENQSQTEGIGFQSPAAGSYPGMQMDDFHETPSCFSKLSNPLKKKQGYDFETVGESSSVCYQEVPVSIERGPANAKGVVEVTVSAKDDGSLPPLNQTQSIRRGVQPEVTRYSDKRDPNLSKAGNDKTAVPPVNNLKNYEDKIEQLEKENKLQQGEIQEYKEQLVTLAKEKDDIIASFDRTAENPTPPASDLENYTQRIEQLEQQTMEYQDEIQEYKTQVVMLTRERDDITARAADNPPSPVSEVENYTEVIEQLEQQSKAYQDEIQEYKTQMVMLRKERDDITARLSEEWDQKVAADESNVENINIQNRPLRLTEEYELLCSPEWNEAKDALDQHSDMSEYGKLTLLCNIMLESAKVCAQRYDEVLANIVLQISQPFVDPNTLEDDQGSDTPQVKSPHLQNENKEIFDNEPEALRESVALEMIFSGPPYQDGDTLPAGEDKSNTDKQLRGKTTSVEENGSDTEEIGEVGSVSNSERGHEDHASTDIGNNMQRVSVGEDMDQVDNYSENNPRQNQDVHFDHLNADSEEVKLRVKHGSIQAGNTLSSKSGQLSQKDNNSKQKYAYLESRVFKVEIPKHLEVMLGDMMRKSAHKVEVTEMTHVINEYIEISTSFSLKSGVRLKHLEPLQKYITTCLQFGWKMALQRPKMVYSTEGIGLPWNEKHQNPCYGSDNPHSPTAVVLLYRCPELLLGDKVLTKGTVLIKEQLDSE